jgi:phage gp29-like protein
MYPHWYFVQAIYKIMGIGIERNLLGAPVGKQGEGAQADDKSAMLTILRRLRAAEDAAITLPYGWSVEWFESARNVMDAMPFLQHHNTMIAQVALAQFLNLGQLEHGTQALAKEHTEIFQLAEEAHAGWIEETLNRQLAPRWCRLNYGEKLRSAGAVPPEDCGAGPGGVDAGAE